jgi:hypothetical protein
MIDEQNHEPGAESRFEIDTAGLTAHELPSTPRPQVRVVDCQSAAAAPPGAAARSPSAGVILVSESDPMTDLAGKVQLFEPFEIRRRKSFLEITVRIIQGTLAVFFSLAALVVSVMSCVVGGPRGGSQDLVYLLVVDSGVLLLATLTVFVTARRFVYWMVNQAGLDQYWFGSRIWSLPWKEIDSCRLGPVATPSWLFRYLIPIAGGLYQPIVLKDRQGRQRKVNRLRTNGDRLDAFLRLQLNPASVLGGVALIFIGAFFFPPAGTVARGSWEWAVRVLLFLASIFGASVILWKGIRSLSLDKLVKLEDASSGAD